LIIKVTEKSLQMGQKIVYGPGEFVARDDFFRGGVGKVNKSNNGQRIIICLSKKVNNSINIIYKKGTIYIRYRLIKIENAD
jgi:hypothetical protein